MIDPLLWVAPLAALAVVAAFGFVGCVGDDEIIAEQQKKDADAVAVKQASQQYPAVVSTTPNLVAYWRLSEGETGATVAPDSGPLKKDGQYKNPAGVTRSVAGALSVAADATDKAAEFDGVQGYAEVPYDIVLNPPIYFSVELWVRPPDAPATPQVIAGAYDVDATGVLSRGFVLDIVPGPPPKFRVRLGNATPGLPVASLEFDYDTGLNYEKWRHIVITYDGGSKVLTVYRNCIDGAPAGTLPSETDPPAYYQFNQTAPLLLAAGWDEVPGPHPTIGRFFKGRIDEVALYNGVLDSKTIQNHFQRGTSLPS